MAPTLRVQARVVEDRRAEFERAWPSMRVALSDGRTPGVPLAWFPRLVHATPQACKAYRLSAFGIHWESLDEDIAVAGLLAGRGDGTGIGGAAA